MSFIHANDGTNIFYKDWGQGRPVVFSHGWPLSADAWDAQMLFLAQQGYRVIAHDRRGHGRSDQPSQGNDMDTYADDLSTLIEALDLRDVALVGHSTGGGEVVRYVGRHGTKRVVKLVLVGAVPPLMLRTDTNPEGTPLDTFDAIRQGVATNRSQFYQDLTTAFYGFDRDGAKVSQGLRDSFWRQGMMGGILGQYACIHEFSELDYSADLKAVDVPTLIVHGDDDQIVPITASALKVPHLVPHAILKIYPGAGHGLAQVQVEEFNRDLLTFLEQGS
jgi:non-heme chloroperoxidase